jgi:hypothetical protein
VRRIERAVQALRRLRAIALGAIFIDIVAKVDDRVEPRLAGDRVIGVEQAAPVELARNHREHGIADGSDRQRPEAPDRRARAIRGREPEPVLAAGARRLGSTFTVKSRAARAVVRPEATGAPSGLVATAHWTGRSPLRPGSAGVRRVHRIAPSRVGSPLATPCTKPARRSPRSAARPAAARHRTPEAQARHGDRGSWELLSRGSAGRLGSPCDAQIARR